MTTKTFQIATYDVNLARETTMSGGAIKFYSYIQCRGDDHMLQLYFLKPDSQDMENRYLPEKKWGRSVLPWDQYPVYMDMLRHEKPVYAYLNSDRPDLNGIYTGQEPIGEEES
ncbi:MAG: hypothetical protein QNK37_36080 [Acidobacteriota bacterium]|nr:hypothetical protein [Acidobacteriota bacterium]